MAEVNCTQFSMMRPMAMTSDRVPVERRTMNTTAATTMEPANMVVPHDAIGVQHSEQIAPASA